MRLLIRPMGISQGLLGHAEYTEALLTRGVGGRGPPGNNTKARDGDVVDVKRGGLAEASCQRILDPVQASLKAPKDAISSNGVAWSVARGRQSRFGQSFYGQNLLWHVCRL